MGRRGGIAALLGCLAIIASLAFALSITGEDPYRQAAVIVGKQGDSLARIRILSRHMKATMLQWSEMLDVYETLVTAVDEYSEAHPGFDSRKTEAHRLHGGAAAVVALQATDEEQWELAQTAFAVVDETCEHYGATITSIYGSGIQDYIPARLRTLSAVAQDAIVSPAELQNILEQMAKHAVDLHEEYVARFSASLSAIAGDPNIEPALRLAACQHASWAAFAAEDGRFLELCRLESELSPDEIDAVYLPTCVADDLGERVEAWRVARGLERALAAYTAGQYGVVLQGAARVASELSTRSPHLNFGEELVERGFFSWTADALAREIRTGNVPIPDGRDRLLQLEHLALRLPVSEDVDSLNSRALGEILVGLTESAPGANPDLEVFLLEEQAYLSLALGISERVLESWTLLAGMKSPGPDAYTLQELLLHPEIARFVIEGNGSYTDMRIRFTYVAKAIEVTVYPVPIVLRYHGEGGYQDMAIYEIRTWTISAAPTVKIVPAVCLDFTAKTPAMGVADYTIENWGDQAVPWSDVLESRLRALEQIENCLERFAKLELHGDWDAFARVRDALGTRLQAVLTWNVTNPEEWNRERLFWDLISWYAEASIADYLVIHMPDDDLTAEEREAVSRIMAQLLSSYEHAWEEPFIELTSDWPSLLRQRLHHYISRSIDEILAACDVGRLAADIATVLQWLGSLGVEL